jgi:hypothetical protein
MPPNRRSISFLERNFSPSNLLFPTLVSLMMWAIPAMAGRLIMSDAELARRPMTGPGWTNLKSVADGPLGAPNISDQDNRHAVKTLAVALVAARTGDPRYAAKARQAIASAIGTDHVDRNTVLAVGRSLGAYVMAADLIGYRDPAFLAWIKHLRDDDIGTHGRWKSIRFCSEDTASNWGSFALASRIAVSAYLGDRADLDRCWKIFTGYTDGSWPFRETAAYQAAWQCGSSFRAINSGCTKDGMNLDGAPVEDASRNPYPHPHAGYVTEGFEGYVVQAMLLKNQGYDAWNAGSERMKRVADFQLRFYIFNYHPVGYHIAWMLNHFYGTSYPTMPAGYGRLFGYTDWLFGSERPQK